MLDHPNIVQLFETFEALEGTLDSVQDLHVCVCVRVRERACNACGRADASPCFCACARVYVCVCVSCVCRVSCFGFVVLVVCMIVVSFVCLCFSCLVCLQWEFLVFSVRFACLFVGWLVGWSCLVG